MVSYQDTPLVWSFDVAEFLPSYSPAIIERDRKRPAATDSLQFSFFFSILYMLQKCQLLSREKHEHVRDKNCWSLHTNRCEIIAGIICVRKGSPKYDVYTRKIANYHLITIHKQGYRFTSQSFTGTIRLAHLNDQISYMCIYSQYVDEMKVNANNASRQ